MDDAAENKPFWSDFVYARMLDLVRLEIEDVYKEQDNLRDAYDFLNKNGVYSGKGLPDKTMKKKLREKIADTKSNVKTAIKAAKDFALGFAGFSSMDVFTRFSGAYADSDGKVSLRYGEFDAFERAIDNRLEELLPDMFPEENMNWPGALSVQQTLSLYTHLCLRIHSEMPDEDHRKVLETAARMVIFPAMAFAVYQSGMAGEPQPYAVRCLETIAAGKEQLPKPKAFEGEGSRSDRSKRVRAARQCVEEHAWQRLFVSLRGQACFLGEKFAREASVECLRMLRDHVNHPHGSDLWKSLSRLSSTTPGASDLLVFEALSRMGYAKPTEAMKARLHCSRTRYEAIASGYYDSEFRGLLNKDAATISDYVAKHSKGWGTTEKLAKAFLLSRRCLIPSDSERGADLADQVRMADMVDELLSACRTGNSDPSVNLLVNRYLAGFLTNPRFVKPARRDLAGIAAAVKEYAVMAKDSGNAPDVAIIDLFEGRIEWIRMLRGDATLSKKVFARYGAALKALFELDNRKEIIDSEVPVWLLPEVITLISLADHVDDAEVYGQSFTKEIKPPTAHMNFATVMQKVGERHYGIYFNMHAELRRICLGVVRASETGK
jgi:hypothetical protein